MLSLKHCMLLSRLTGHAWLPTLLFVLWFGSGACSLFAAIVINEVCYDPTGADEGHEWVELYNNGTANEQLNGAKILAGGSVFSLQYTLPAFVLRPGRYLLIGESLVPNTQMVAELNLQNGTDGTDGVRYLGPDGEYTDTVLYDFPNVNHLPDDENNIGTSLALPASNGRSLSRIRDGQDSNQCAFDFMAEQSPTPGLVNRLHTDYALGTYDIAYVSGEVVLDIYLINAGPLVPVNAAGFDIIQGGNTLFHSDILPIGVQDSTLVHAEFVCPALPLEFSLALPDDPDSTNNSLIVNLDGGELPGVMINEFLADPDAGNQEWLELYVPAYTQKHTPKKTTDYTIQDASSGKIRFFLPDQEGYYAVCSDTLLLKERYPNCPSEAIIEATGWTNLNNDGDVLVLYAGEAVLDSLVYLGDSILRDVSRERYLDETQQVQWRGSFDVAGGTPGLANSLPPQQEYPDPGNVTLMGSPFNPSAGEQLTLSYAFTAENNRISCKVFDLRGIKIVTLADYAVASAQGVMHWNGKKQDGSYAPRGLYIILWEAQNGGTGKVQRKQLTAVIKS